jgi:spore coat-associated protein N
MRGRLIPLITCVVLLGGLGAVALGQVGRPSPARAAAVRATGAFEISNSIEGQPIFAAKEIGPGNSAKGRVTIEDSGSVPVALKLSREGLGDALGIGGGALSGRLQLTITDVTGSGTPRTIYSGPLDSMPEQNAGELQPDRKRTYEFVAALPEGAPSEQNALQSASTSVAYSWTAVEASGSEEVEEKAKEQKEEKSPERGTGDGGGTPETRGTTGGGGQGTGSGGGAGVEAALGLTVPKIVSTHTGSAFITYFACEATCRIHVTGRLRATAHGHLRVVKVRFGVKHTYAPGSQKLRIPVPRGMRRWLHRMPPPKRLRARLRFVAIGSAGGRDVVTRQVKLRVRRR